MNDKEKVYDKVNLIQTLFANILWLLWVLVLVYALNVMAGMVTSFEEVSIRMIALIVFIYAIVRLFQFAGEPTIIFKRGFKIK